MIIRYRHLFQMIHVVDCSSSWWRQGDGWQSTWVWSGGIDLELRSVLLLNVLCSIISDINLNMLI